jgi:hypothetical protein
MKIVIQTQHRENYGSHDWDGEGECPQYWKFKGGNTYVVHGVTIEQNLSAEWWKSLESAIESSSEYFEEYIISSDIVDEVDYDESKVCADWESPVHLVYMNGVWAAKRITTPDFPTNWGELALKRETWVQHGSERMDYLCVYERKDGVICDWQGEPLVCAA